MELYRLANNLRFAIPQELYQLEPNKVTLFVPKEGVSQLTIITLQRLLQYFRFLCRENNVNLFFYPTENEALIDKMAIRIPQGKGLPDKVVISTWETVAGFASQLFGEDVNKIVEKHPKSPIQGPIRISAENLPIVIDLPLKDNPADVPTYIDSDSYDDPGMGMLQKRPETDKERKELVAKYEQKFRKMLWECAYLGIDLNINGIVEEVELNKTKTEGYGLSLQMEKNTTSGSIDCKVFVGDGLEMKVTAVRKAVYLAFLTLEDGLVIEEATQAFTKRIQNIYRQLPDREEKEEKEGGLLYVDYIQSKTLRGYMSDINSAIAKLVPNGLIAIELSIEGLKEEAFKVMRSTPEIREQIIKAFNL